MQTSYNPAMLYSLKATRCMTVKDIKHRNKLICTARANGASIPQLILASGLTHAAVRRILFNA